MMKTQRERSMFNKARLCLLCETTLGVFVALSMCFLFADQVSAQAPPYEWARQAQGWSGANGITLDGMNNIYMTGSFSTNVTFGGVTLKNLSFGGGMFLVKYDSRGNALWATNATGTESFGTCSGLAVATDVNGNVYVTGSFERTVSFGSTTLNSGSCCANAFFAKYDRNGNLAWVRSVQGIVGGPSVASAGFGIAVDPGGDVHVVGVFLGPANVGGIILTSTPGNGHDVFHVKLASDGTPRWAQSAGGANDDFANAVAADVDGNTYLTGYFQSDVMSFGAIQLTNSRPIYQNIFVCKYDATGGVLWARSAGSTTPDYPEQGRGIAVDSLRNVYITGRFTGTTRFGNTNLVAAGLIDIFIAKYDAFGNLAWASNAGSVGAGNGIVIDSAGKPYVTGNFTASASFGGISLVSRGSSDVFMAKYDTNGVGLWAKQAGSTLDDSGNAIAIDSNGNTYIAGQFTDSATFDSTAFTNSGTTAFLAKIPATTPIPPTITMQPQSASVRAGSNVTFTVLAGGTPAPDFQWQLNGTNLVGETHFTLSITNAQIGNQGNYRVVVTNTGGSQTSLVATLTILLPPSIIEQPLSQVVIAGTDVMFSISADGTTPLRYQWRVNGADIPGATNGTLIASNAQPVNAGDYTIVVTNDYGAVTSSIAILTVRYSLTIRAIGGGTVTQNPAQADYAPNFVVGLTAVPTVDHVFSGWSGNAAGTENPLSVTMATNKVITANFITSDVRIAIQGEGTVAKSPDNAFYHAGDQVMLTATPARWFSFTRWADGPTADQRVITIGANNSYTAIFSPTTAVETLSFSNVSRTAPVGMPAIFVDGEFVVTNSLTRLDSAQLSMLTSFSHGSILYTLDGSPPTIGSNVRLYVAPILLKRSALVRAIAYDANFTRSWEADPVEVLIEPTYRLSATTPGGGTVAVLPVSASYRSNSSVTVTATPASGWTFLQWLGDASGLNPTNTVVMTRNRCVQALFGTAFGTAATGAGSVSVDPALATYPFGTAVLLTAAPQDGNYFVAWGNAANSTDNPLLFVVNNASQTVSCLFAPLSSGQFALTVIASGRGQVSSSPRGNRFNAGQNVTLTALPEANQSFFGWSGDASGSQTNLLVVMNQSKVITANFTRWAKLSLGPCLGGMREDGFQMTLAGELGARYELDGSVDLVHWTPINSLTNAFGLAQFLDAGTTNQPFRFYRALPAP